MTAQELLHRAAVQGACTLMEEFRKLAEGLISGEKQGYRLEWVGPHKDAQTESRAPREPRKRHMSASARKRIGAAQKKRWAEWRARKASEKS